MKLEKYSKAVSAFQKLIQTPPGNPVLYYHIACIYGRQNRKDDAVAWLEKAIHHGYDNWTHLQSDADLSVFRQTAYYKKLIKPFNVE